jgi:hypothetical protein
MNEIGNMLLMFVLGLAIGALYGRMKGQQVEDELLIHIADLTQHVRILKKRLDSK